MKLKKMDILSSVIGLSYSLDFDSAGWEWYYHRYKRGLLFTGEIKNKEMFCQMFAC